MNAQFPQWTAADFDAYLEPKWRSNRFNLERMRTREKLVQFQQTVLENPALQGEGQALEWTHDHPTVFNQKMVKSQWAFLIRNEEARRNLIRRAEKNVQWARQADHAPVHHKNIALCAEIDAQKLGLFLGIHRECTVDFGNLEAVLADDAAGEEFLFLSKQLGEWASLCMGAEGGVPASPPLSQWSRTDWIAAIRAWKESDAEWLRVGVWWPRETCLSTGEAEPAFLPRFGADLRALMVRLEWTAQNNFIGLVEPVENTPANEREKDEKQETDAIEVPAQRAAAPLEMEPEEPKGPFSILGNWRETRRNHPPRKDREERAGERANTDSRNGRNDEEPRSALRSDSGDRNPTGKRRPGTGDRNGRETRHHERGQRRERTGRQTETGERNERSSRRNEGGSRSRNRESSPVQGKKRGKDRATASAHSFKEKTRWVETEGSIEPGVTVRINSGLFAGKRGEVLEVNGKGDCKVLVGMLPTRIPAHELTLLTTQ